MFSALGLFLHPERIDMPIGDMLKRVALGQTLSQSEAEILRQWGNRSESLNAFANGIQTGVSDVSAGTLQARFGDFEVPPTNGAYFGRSTFFTGSYDQALLASGTVLTDAYSKEFTTPESIVVFYDKPNGKFQINPRFASSSLRAMEVNGHFYLNDVTSLRGGLHWYYKSDDSLFGTYAVNLVVTGIANELKEHAFVVHQLFDQFTVDIASLYFTIKLYPGVDTNIMADVFFKRVL
jgi:hypothetical protein